jgi:hypothetical protein
MLVAAGPGLLLAHQGGWDEVVFLLAPLILFAVLMAVARRRVEGEDDVSDEDPPTEPDVT